MTDPTPALRLQVRGGAKALRPAAARVTGDVLARGVPAGQAAAIELAIHELLANALEHGHLGDPALPIEVEVTGAEPGAVTVRVSDRALGGGWPTARRATAVDRARGVRAEALRGRGLALACAAAAGFEVVADDGCTEVVLRLSTLPALRGGAG